MTKRRLMSIDDGPTKTDDKSTQNQTSSTNRHHQLDFTVDGLQWSWLRRSHSTRHPGRNRSLQDEQGFCQGDTKLKPN